MARSINWLQVGAALLLGLFGLYVIVQGSGYEMGSLRRMGPGFFPVMIGSVLLLFAVLLVLEVSVDSAELCGIGNFGL